MLLFTFTPDFPAEYREILYLADQLPYFSTFAGFPTRQGNSYEHASVCTFAAYVFPHTVSNLLYMSHDLEDMF